MASHVLRDYLVILNPSKCGSTWLAKTLSVRPYLLSPGELDFIFFLEFPLEKQWNRATAEDPEFLSIRNSDKMSLLDKLEALYSLARSRHADVTMLIDKSPSNALVFPRYYHLFRSSRIVVLHRDPRDVFVSLEFFYQNVLKNKPSNPDIGDVDYLLHNSCLWYAVKNARATLECEKLLARAKIPFLRITYEALAADLPAVARKVLSFTGLEIRDDTVILPREDSAPLSLGRHLDAARSSKPLFRKGIVGDWRNYLSSKPAKEVVKHLAGDLLIELGYESDYTW